jgi:superfamily II DNA or RNA helicase
MIQSIVGTHAVNRVSTKPHVVVKILTGVLAEEKRGKMGLIYMDLCKKLNQDEKRNKMIIDIITTNPHRKFMVLTRTVEHVELLQKLLTEMKISVGVFYGKTKSYSDSSVLIGTLSKIGVGFDEANTCPDYKGIPSDTLILCNSISETSTYEQARGRIMRCNDPYILYLVDENKNVQKHFNHNKGWMLYTKAKIVEIEYQEKNIIIPRARS